MARYIQLEEADCDEFTSAAPACGAAGLRAVYSKLSDKDQSFAASLLKGYDKYGRFTAAQTPWVQKLIDKAINGAPVPVVVDLAVTSGNSLAGVRALFAGTKLRNPKLMISTSDGAEVEISVAGASARVPGSLNVTDGGPFGSNVWYGRVVGDEFRPSDRSTPDVQRKVLVTLTALAADPLGTVVAYGHKTGRCACCGRKLSDDTTKGRDGKTSVERGVGPVCMTRWNLG